MIERTFEWKNCPRIITYPNPRTIDKEKEVYEIMTSYPHLCASDTLMMGLTQKYKRENFTYLMTVDAFLESIFHEQITGKEFDLQMFLNVSEKIEGLKKQYGDRVYKAFVNNKGELFRAFKLLISMNYIANPSELGEEQKVFFEGIYNKLYEEYTCLYKKVFESISKEDYLYALERGLIKGAKYSLNDEELGNNIKSVKEALQKKVEKNVSGASCYLDLINRKDSFKTDTVVIHGVARFTPEIMLMIQVLDCLGISVIFMINYVDNLPNLYSFWKKTYEWLGCEFEYTKSIDLTEGNVVGKNIALICEGKRPQGASHAQLIKYSTITDFTDGPVRLEFQLAQRKSRRLEEENHIESRGNFSVSPLSQMNTQYYSVVADKPNDILRNYFPEQFIDKPFLSYPVGQFIVSLFNMWNYEENRLEIDFTCLKECATVRICHNNPDMVMILNELQEYYRDIKYVNELNDRIKKQLLNLESFTELDKRMATYLSYYSGNSQRIKEFMEYVNSIDELANSIFAKTQKERIIFQQKFKDIVELVNDKKMDDSVLSEKEDELIKILLNTLNLKDETPVQGGMKDLKEALFFYLSTKKKSSGADWIVRGFDQIDGAPLMKMPVGRIYEFSLMSMKNMTKTVRDVLPWPLDERLLDSEKEYSVFLVQLKNMVELRNEYLRFYFFYGAFFSKGAQINFSYVENENDQKQRPYYILDMLGLGRGSKKKDNGRHSYEVHDEYTTPSIVEMNLNQRELDIFSICRYKYFIMSILGKVISYKSNYHILYFLENEITNRVQERSNYDPANMESALEKELKSAKKVFPYMDNAMCADITRYVRQHYSTQKMGETYLRRKRDFLLAKWTDEETNQNCMQFTKNKTDVLDYLRSTNILPVKNDKPHEKICEECNFSDLCLNYYVEKEVEV